MNFSSLGPHTDENESPLKKAYSENASTLLSTLLNQTKKLKTEVTEEKDDPMGDETEYIKLKLVGQYSHEIHFMDRRAQQQDQS